VKPAAGDPVVIGLVQRSGELDATESLSSEQILAIETDVNISQGGIAGRPLTVVGCAADNNKEFESCVETFQGDGAFVILVANDMAFSTKVLASAAQTTPIVVAHSTRASTLASSVLIAMSPGFPGVVQGMVIAAGVEFGAAIKDLLVVRYGDEDSGALFAWVIRPVLVKLGVDPTKVRELVVENTSDAEAVRSRLSKMDNVPSHVLVLVSDGACKGVALWKSSDAPQTVVVAPELCSGALATDAAAGWYTLRYANQPVDTLRESLNATIEALRARPVKGLTPQALKAVINSSVATLGLSGDAPACAVSAVYPALCSTKLTLAEFRDGVRVDIRGGTEGNAIDMFTDLEGVDS